MPRTGRIVSVPSFMTQPFAGNFVTSFALTQPADVLPSQRSCQPSAFSAAVSVFASAGAGFIFGATLIAAATPL